MSEDRAWRMDLGEDGLSMEPADDSNTPPETLALLRKLASEQKAPAPPTPESETRESISEAGRLLAEAWERAQQPPDFPTFLRALIEQVRDDLDHALCEADADQQHTLILDCRDVLSRLLTTAATPSGNPEERSNG